MDLGRRVRRLSNAVRRTVVPGGDDLSRGERFFASAARFVIQIGREFAHDRCPRQAAALAFATLLALVPLATVVLALTQWVEAIGDPLAVERLLDRFVLPEAAEVLSERIAGAARQVDFAAIGWVGGGALLVLGGLLFLQVEDVLNDIWNVPHGRPFWRRVLVLLGLLFAVLPAFAAALYLSVERLAAPLDVVAPAGLLLLALVLAYKLTPHVRVRWPSALAGALVAATLVGGGHEMFGMYVETMRWHYEGIYGAIAFVPIALFWIYLAWLFFLVGAEVSYTGQHLDALWARARRSGEMAAMRQDVVGGVSWPNAIRLAVGVAEAERSGTAPIDAEMLAVRLAIPVEAARLLASRLVTAGVLRRDPEGRLLMARPAAEIRLVEIHDAVVDRRPLGTGLDDLVSGHRAALQSRTLADGLR